MRSPDKTDRVALVACILVGLAVRLAWIGRDDLWSDEVQTLGSVSLPLADVVGERLRAGHVPLYFLLLRGWTELFGASQTALRVPSALLGTALLLPAFTLLRRLVPPSAARWGLLVVALHPTFVELSREARMYPLLALAFVVAADGAVAALDGDRGARLPLRFWVAVAIGPFVHPSWGFAAAPLAVWLAVEARLASRAGAGAGNAGDVKDDGCRAATARRAAWALVASMVLLVALLLQATPQHQELTRRPWARELLVFVLRPLVGTDLRPDLTGIVAVTLAGWGVCLWRGSREDAPRARRFALALGVGVPVASVASGVIGGLPWGPVRYVHLCALGLVVLASLTAERSRRVQEEIGRRAASMGDGGRPPGFLARIGGTGRDWIGLPWLAVALLVLLASRTSSPRTAWSAAARDVAADVPPTETVWVDDEGSAVVLSHYLRSGASDGAGGAGARDVGDGRVGVGRPPVPGVHWRAAVDARASVPVWDVYRAER